MGNQKLTLAMHQWNRMQEDRIIVDAKPEEAGRKTEEHELRRRSETFIAAARAFP
jgi:hypothetical protein